MKREQDLADNVLPLPSVRWAARDWSLEITPVSFGTPGASSTAVRYRFHNRGAEPFAGKLALALRPVQLNPKWQFGGMSPINSLHVDDQEDVVSLRINNRVRVMCMDRPSEIGAVAFAQQGDKHVAELRNQVTSPGGTSAEALYHLEKGGLRTVISRAIWAAYQRSVSLGQGKRRETPPTNGQ